MAVIWGTSSGIPNPTKADLDYVQIGATHNLASGAQVMDVVVTKKRFTLKWENVSTAEKNLIVTPASIYALAGTSLNLSAVTGYGTYSVNPVPGSLKVAPIGVTPAWTVDVQVREV